MISQRQDSLSDQLRDLDRLVAEAGAKKDDLPVAIALANRNGLYDAADHVTRQLERERMSS